MQSTHTLLGSLPSELLTYSLDMLQISSTITTAPFLLSLLPSPLRQSNLLSGRVARDGSSLGRKMPLSLPLIHQKGLFLSIPLSSGWKIISAGISSDVLGR